MWETLHHRLFVVGLRARWFRETNMRRGVPLDSLLQANDQGNRAAGHQEDARSTENLSNSLTLESPRM